MQMEPGPHASHFLLLRLLMDALMGAVVIDDQMDVQMAGYIPVNMLEG